VAGAGLDDLRERPKSHSNRIQRQNSTHFPQYPALLIYSLRSKTYY
jgi:hypothetical protein